MPSSLFTPANHNASPPSLNANNPRSRVLLSLLLFITSILAYLGTSPQHSLLTGGISWVLLWLYTRLKTGSNRRLHGLAQTSAWSAGALFALGQICARAVEGRGTWWGNGLLPLAVYFLLRWEVTGNVEEDQTSPPGTPEKSHIHISAHGTSGSKTALFLLTIFGVLAIAIAPGGTPSGIALGLSYTIFTALAFLLVGKAGTEAKSGRLNSGGGGAIIYSANGLLSHAGKSVTAPGEAQIAVVKDVSAAAATATGIATFALESFTIGGLTSWSVIGQGWGSRQVFGQSFLMLGYGLGMVGVHCALYWTVLVLIQRQGTLTTSFVPLFAAIATQLICDFTPSRLWFAALCAASTFVFSDERESFSHSNGERKRMRFTRLLTLIAAITFGVFAVLRLREPYERAKWGLRPDKSIHENLVPLEAPEPLAPKAFPNTHEHPIAQLIRDADASWEQVLQSQSSTLEEAVAEYKRRYNIPPPPNFDKWYTFARLKGVQLIDEFDTVYKTLLPFWGLAPSTIRARAREAIGYADNMLMGLAIRDGEVSVVEGGQDWLQQAAVGMIGDFVQWLPDMDLAFNTHDEPRVVVPHDDLSRLVRIALDENMPAAFANASPKNAFSSRPEDMNSGRRFPECRTTRFNWYAHQSVWDPSRLSCAPSTPARSLDETQAADNLTAYALGELGFIYNQTAFSDICNSPSLATSFGFFERPNAFNTVHDLFPVFSQSKVSAFQDLLYPSPWYWWDKVPYNSAKDIEWKAKIPKLFWRGSTTGGFSRAGGWRRQHRQNFVGKLNALDQAKILQDTSAYEGMDGSATREQNYRIKEVSRQDYKDSIDVHFSHIGQCDPGDCDAQREFFTMKDGVEMQEHWKWKFLLDIDGNAFSGRFYAFLKSKSLALKMSIFREWHQEWLRPWVHYIPLSLRGEEVLESVRYLSAESEGGKPLAEKVASQGREWAGKALRNEDFEVWFFRVLLEYGRVVDDERESIGYGG